MLIPEIEKTIIVRSFGLEHPEYFPKFPSSNARTMFFMTDVRFMSDPCRHIDEAGDEGEVYEIIINRPEIMNFLSIEVAVIYQRIINFKMNARFSALEMNYFCNVGYHRSPAVAAWAHNQIKLMGWEKTGHTLKLEHLTRHLGKQD